MIHLSLQFIKQKVNIGSIEMILIIVSARWIPSLLTGVQKKQMIGSSKPSFKLSPMNRFPQRYIYCRFIILSQVRLTSVHKKNPLLSRQRRQRLCCKVENITLCCFGDCEIMTMADRQENKIKVTGDCYSGLLIQLLSGFDRKGLKLQLSNPSV